MKKIIALAGSNSKHSINKILATYTANLIEGAKVEVLDLNDYELPMYSIDYEMEYGVHDIAEKMLSTIQSADALVVSLAEYNGSYTSAFKNAFDWMSRANKEVWGNIPMLLMATSPGGRGGATVLSAAKTTFPHLGGNIVADFSLPSFGNNFVAGALVNEELKTELDNAVNKLTVAMN
ncbi:MAG: NAD(P)H-dependent oxidoreductase [Flavobacteriaceae bacterium]|nr:NAD(P)H-dependent oxidoreductase [Flavobacteriaceae bacterium]